MAITRYSPRHVIVVTFGLSAAGAVFGGLAGSAALGLALILSGELTVLKGFGILAIPGIIGAALGAVCAPLAGWLLLRRVPLGRVFGGLTIGTVLGGLIGWFLPVTFNPITQPIVAAAAGFLGAAIALRVRQARQDAGRTLV